MKIATGVAEAMFNEKLIKDMPPENITLIGDSAGGNLVQEVCQKARDTGDFFPSETNFDLSCSK